MTGGCDALTEREKQTLRLLLGGHDAKSIARHLDLSVHTINERLREARRKLSVSSSREAARLLAAAEAPAAQFSGTEPPDPPTPDARSPDPQSLGDTRLGDAPAGGRDHLSTTPDTAPPPRRPGLRVIGGLTMIAILAAALALLSPADGPQAGTQVDAAAETDASRAARDWLARVDAGDWAGSYAGTAASFRSLNTLDAWRAASEKARVPLGRMLSRTLLDEHDTPAPPRGYRTIRFRTDFANRAGATETVSLDQEGGGWKVVGVYIE